MGDLQLVFFQYVSKTPSLAGCAKCHLKFFTPHQLMRQPQAAAEYLREKFARHICKWEIFEETGAGIVQTRRLRIKKQTKCGAISNSFKTGDGPEIWKKVIVHLDHPRGFYRLNLTPKN